MYFDKLPIAFRCRIIFDESLNLPSAYFFVDVSKISTVADFIKVIQQRFNIRNDLTVSLQGVWVPREENILILVDVPAVEIQPTTAYHKPANEKHDERKSINSTNGSFVKTNTAQFENIPPVSQPTEKKHESMNKNKNDNYSGRGLAGFIKRLREDENVITKHDSNFQSDQVKQIDEKSESSSSTVDNNGEVETNHVNKRKRKRKHKKNSKHSNELDPGEVDSLKNDSQFAVPSTTRKHIFFDNIEAMDLDCNDDKITSEVSSPPLVEEVQVRKLENNDEQQSFSTISSEKSASQCPGGTEELSSIATLNTKSITPDKDIDKELSTLMMLKEINTTDSYFVSYNGTTKQLPQVEPSKLDEVRKMEIQSNDKSNPATNSNTLNGATACINVDSSDSDDCSVVLQYRINEDTILLRRDDKWQMLDRDIPIDELSTITTPCEQQAIVFRIYFLKDGMIPQLSDALFGRVINYDSANKMIVLEIPDAFIAKIGNVLEGVMILPDGMNNITDNIYECEWSSIQNPRILSS